MELNKNDAEDRKNPKLFKAWILGVVLGATGAIVLSDKNKRRDILNKAEEVIDMADEKFDLDAKNPVHWLKKVNDIARQNREREKDNKLIVIKAGVLEAILGAAGAIVFTDENRRQTIIDKVKKAGTKYKTWSQAKREVKKRTK